MVSKCDGTGSRNLGEPQSSRSNAVACQTHPLVTQRDKLVSRNEGKLQSLPSPRRWRPSDRANKHPGASGEFQVGGSGEFQKMNSGYSAELETPTETPIDPPQSSGLGLSWQFVRRACRVPEAVGLRAVVEALKALDAFHRGGSGAHGALWPGNLMFRKDGVAFLVYDAERLLPSPLGYVAPEVRRGLEPTPASDLFSLGVILLEVLSGKSAGSEEPEAFVRRVNAAVTPGDPLLSVALRATASAPGARYRSAPEFAGELFDRLRGRMAPTAALAEMLRLTVSYQEDRATPLMPVTSAPANATQAELEDRAASQLSVQELLSRVEGSDDELTLHRGVPREVVPRAPIPHDDAATRQLPPLEERQQLRAAALTTLPDSELLDDEICDEESVDDAVLVDVSDDGEVVNSGATSGSLLGGGLVDGGAVSAGVDRTVADWIEPLHGALDTEVPFDERETRHSTTLVSIDSNSEPPVGQAAVHAPAATRRRGWRGVAVALLMVGFAAAATTAMMGPDKLTSQARTLLDAVASTATGMDQAPSDVDADPHPSQTSPSQDMPLNAAGSASERSGGAEAAPSGGAAAALSAPEQVATVPSPIESGADPEAPPAEPAVGQQRAGVASTPTVSDKVQRSSRAAAGSRVNTRPAPVRKRRPKVKPEEIEESIFGKRH